MGVRTWLESWPVYRQLTGDDPLGRGTAAQSPRSKALEPRTADGRPDGLTPSARTARSAARSGST